MKYHIFNLLILHFIFFQSCSNKENEEQASEDLLTITIVSGQDQEVSPQTPLAQPIIFEVRDRANQTVPNLNVSAALLPIAGSESSQEVKSMWLTKKLAEPSGELTDEDTVGSLVSSEITTDINGQAAILVNSVTTFDTTVAVVIGVELDGILVGFQNTKYKTVSFGDSERIVITSSNGLQEKKGEPFDIKLSLIGPDGRALKGFNETVALDVAFTVPEGVAKAEVYNGEMMCKFANGQCRLPKGPFLISGSGEVRLSISAPNVSFTIPDTIITVSDKTAGTLLLSLTDPKVEITDPCPDIPKEARSLIEDPCVLIPSDLESFKLYPVVVGPNDEFLYDTSTIWDVTGPLANTIRSHVATDHQEILVTKGGSGLLHVTTPEGKSITLSYKVNPGDPHHIRIGAEENKASATKPLELIITIFDKNDLLVDSYEGTLDVSLTLTGASSAPDGTHPIVEDATTLQFSKGIATYNGQLLAPKARETIYVEATSLYPDVRSDGIHIHPGETDSIQLHNAADNAGNHFEFPLTVSAGSNFDFFVLGFDRYLNFVGNTVSQFSGTEILADNESILNHSSSHLLSLSFDKVGQGTLLTTMSSRPDITLEGHITVGANDAAVGYLITTTNNLIETAGQSFGIQIKAVDTFNNLATGYNKTVKISIVNFGIPSWLAKKPILPDGFFDCQFVDGSCTLKPPPPLTENDFFITDADIATLITVTDTTEEIKGDWSSFITAVPGQPAELVFADSTGGEKAGAKPLDIKEIHISSDDSVTLAAAAVDKGGNFLYDVDDALWQSNLEKIRASMSTAGPSPKMTYNPVKVVDVDDDGKMSVIFSDIDTKTFDIVVIHGEPADIKFEMEGGMTASAGDCRQISATIVDQDGNHATRVTSENLFLKMGMKNRMSGSAPSPHMSGITRPTIQIGGGEKVRFVSGFYKSNESRTSYYAPKFELDKEWSYLPYGSSTPNSPHNILNSGGTRQQCINGVVNFSYEACFADATNISPIIAISIPEFAINNEWFPELTFESEPITVIKSQPAYVSFDSEASSLCGHESIVGINFPKNFSSDHGGKTCSTTDVTGDGFKIYAVIKDFGGNKLSLGTGYWNTDDLSNLHPVLQSNSEFIEIDARKKGYFDLKYVEPTFDIAISSTFALDPRPPYTMTLKQSGSAYTTNFFGISFIFFDEFENQTNFDNQYISSINLNPLNSPSPSPIGTLPQIPSQLKAISGNSTGNIIFLPRANEEISLQVTIDKLPEQNQSKVIKISSQPGIIVSTHIADNDNVDINDLTVTTDDIITSLKVIGKDKEGNFASLIKSTFTYLNPPLTNFYQNSESSISLDPSVVGTNIVTATPEANFPAVSTGTISITPGKPAVFDISIKDSLGNMLINPEIGSPYRSYPVINLNAGETYQLTVSMRDQKYNLIDDFNENLNLIWGLEKDEPNNEGFSHSLPNNGLCQFVDGICATEFTFIPYNNYSGVTNTLNIVTDTDLPDPITNGVIMFTLTPGIMDHFGVISLDKYYPKAALSTLFYSQIIPRDAWGNSVIYTTSDENPVTLSIIYEDGSSTPGTLSGTITNIDFTAVNQMTITDLKYGGSGIYKVLATDGTYQTPLSSSSPIIMVPTLGTIDKYRLIMPPGNPSAVAAGDTFALYLSAIDIYGSKVAADDDLNDLTFTWNGPSASPKGDIPDFGTVNFSNGMAPILMTFYRNETIAAGNFTVTDSASDPKSGVSDVDLLVSPADIADYPITVSHSERTADNDPTNGQFDVTIKTIDAYGNTVLNELGLELQVSYVSGTGTNTYDILGPSGTASETSNLNLASGEKTITGLYYPVPHTVDIMATSPRGIFTAQPQRVTFTPTMATVYDYRIGATANTTTGPDNLSVAVMARDRASNAITGIDSDLNSLQFSWTGAASSPDNTTPVYPSSLVFTNGVAPADLSLFKAEVIASNGLTIEDNYSDGPNRTGNNPNSFIVSPGTATTLSGDTPSDVTAGTSFQLTATVVDNWGNLTDQCGDLSVSGGLDSPGGHGGTATSAILSADVSQSPLGSYQTHPITLFKSGDNPLTLSACGLSDVVTVSVGTASLNTLLLSATNSPPPDVNDAAVLASHTTDGELLCANSGSLVTCAELYSFSWDSYGNQITDSPCTWSYQNISGQNLPTVSGSSQSKFLTNPDFLDGYLVCTAEGQTARVLTYGGISRIGLTHNYSGPINTGMNNFTISEIALYSRKNNTEIANSYHDGDQLLTFASTSSLGFGTPPNGIRASSSELCTLSNGVCNNSIIFSLTDHETISVSASLFGKTATVDNIEVQPNNPVTLDITSVSPKNAGESFTLAVTMKDSFGNLTSEGCGPLTITGGSTSPGNHQGTATPAIIPTDVNQDSLGHYTSGAITLYKAGTETLTVSACSLTETINITVNHIDANSIYLSTTNSAPGALDLASNATSGELLCGLSSTNGSVSCQTVYAFFWDQYGNYLSSDNKCDSWSYSNHSGTSTPSVSGNTHGFTLSHNDFIDGVLTCNKNSLNADVLTYGGISRMEITHDYTGPSIVAANNSVNVSNIKLYFQKESAEIAKTDAGTLTVNFATTSSLGFGGSGLRSQASASCAFSGAGACNVGYDFDFNKVETGRTLTVSLQGLSQTISGITVTPAQAATLTISAVSAKNAGTAFTTTASVVDAFNNPTAVGCGNLTISGGNTSPTGHGGTATDPVIPTDVGQGSVGQYTTGSITLYAAGTETLTFSACSLSENLNITINHVAPNSIYLSTTDAAPASLQLASDLSSGELICGLSASNGSVGCTTIYAFFWDQYGNFVTSDNQCDSWSYSNHSGTTTPSVSGNTHGYTLTHTDFIDGVLSCNKGVLSADVLTYGGVSRMELVHDYTGPSIVAANNSVNISNIKLYFQKESAEIPKTDAGTLSLAFSTDSTLGFGASGLRSQATANCAFSGTGECSVGYGFHFNKVETGRTLTVSLQGLSETISGITVTPATAASLSVAAVSAKNAGEAFTTTVAVVDAFDNPTGEGCGNLTVTGGSSSPGGHGGSATSPSFPVAVSQSAVGFYNTIGNITLFNAGTETLNFNACSLVKNLNVTVNHLTANTIYLSTTDSAPAGIDLATDTTAGELECGNSTGASVGCTPIYAFFWDQYGNLLNSDLSCDSWSYSNISGSGSPTVTGSGHSYTLSHNNYIDGTLTCTKNGKSADVLTYGGLSRVELISDYTGPSETAANNNINLTDVKLYYRKNNTEIAKADAGSETISFTTTSSMGFGASGIRTTNSATCAFSGIGECPDDYAFSFTTVESNVSLTATIRGQSDSVNSITIDPAAAATLTVAAIGNQTAGQAFTASATVVDAFDNPTAVNCTNLAVTGGTTSPGGHEGAATAPVMPTDVGQGSTGQYTTENITLYTTGTQTLTFTACSLPGTNVDVTVEPAATNAIYLTDTDSEPASHTTSFSCTTGQTVTCPEIFAFAWDAYGNNIDSTSYACGSWTYTDHTANDPDPDLSFTSGHSTVASANTWHIDGALTCTVGAVSATADVDGDIEKTYSWSCGNWSCSGGSPTATCTLSNSSGYDISSFTFGGANAGTTLDTTNCDPGLTTGSSCSVTVTGDVGNFSGNLSVAATDGTNVQFIDPATSAVASSAVAPNCTDQLLTTDNGWSCVTGGNAEWSVSITNDNDYEQTVFGASDPSFDLANGATINTTACKNTSLNTGESCSTTIHQATAGQTSTIRFAPTDSYFQDAILTSTNSPNCSTDLSYSTQIVSGYNCIDNGAAGKTKRIEFTLTNQNAQKTAELANLSHNGSSVISDTCSSQNISPSGSCTFVIEWFAAPGTSDTSVGMPTSGTDYFNDLSITSGDVDNSCP